MNGMVDKRATLLTSSARFGLISCFQNYDALSCVGGGLSSSIMDVKGVGMSSLGKEYKGVTSWENKIVAS